MLIKFTTSINFTIILQAAFKFKIVKHNFNVLTVWVCNFLPKGILQKAAHEMLMKLPTVLLKLFEKPFC